MFFRTHLIGPGRRSVLTIHREIEKDKIRNLYRAVRGRYCWDPSIRRQLEGARDAHERD